MPLPPMFRKRRERMRGFSLMEQAVSLTVIGLLLGSIMVPLQTQLENRKVDETRRTLEHAVEMLVAFAAASGYFPCPANATSGGREPPGSDHVSGTCPEWHGFLPAALLGLRRIDAQGYALDAWEGAPNRIRYAVAPYAVGGIAQVLTRVNGMRTVSLDSLASTPLFHVCQSGGGNTPENCGSALTLSSNAAVLVWSVGANATEGGTSVHEAQNPNPNGGSADRVFVSRGPSTAAGHEFDDIVVWLPVTTLISRLLSSGQFTPAVAVAAGPPARAP